MTEQITIFSESMLRGYCHLKRKMVRNRNKVTRTLGELRKKEWHNPVRAILLAFAVFVAFTIILDIAFKLGT